MSEPRNAAVQVATSASATKTSASAPTTASRFRISSSFKCLLLAFVNVVVLIGLVREFEVLGAFETSRHHWFRGANDQEFTQLDRDKAKNGEKCIDFHRGHLETRFAPPKTYCFTRKENRERIVRLVKLTGEIFDQHNITWFLDSGTFLGAHRHQDMIPHDNDADFGIDQRSFEIIRDSAEIEFPKGVLLTVFNSTMHDSKGRDEELPIRVIDTQLGFYVDVFVYLESKDANSGADLMGPLPSNCFISCVECPEVKGHGREFKIPKKWIFPLARCSFAGMELPCPNNADAYFRYLYGRFYMTPQEWQYRRN